jgi:hypothetical protein
MLNILERLMTAFKRSYLLKNNTYVKIKEGRGGVFEKYLLKYLAIKNIRSIFALRLSCVKD